MDITKEILEDKQRNKNYILILSVFLLTTFGGAARKWVFTDSIFSNLIFALQLILPFALLIFGYFKKPVNSQKISDILTPYGIVLLFMTFNPLNVTIYHGIIGYILHFSFWMILFLILQYRDNFQIEKATKLFIIISIFQLSLGALQYSLPADNPLNLYLAEVVDEDVDAGKASVGDAVRVTGTFSYISGFGAYLLFYTFVVCGYIAKKKNNKFLLGLLITFGIYGCFISGSRGVTAFYIIIVFSFLILHSDLLKSLMLLSQTVIGLGLIIIITIGINDPLNSFNRIEQAYNNFSARVEQNKEEGSTRGTAFIHNIINYDGVSPLIGTGLGGGYQGANKLFGLSPFLSGRPPEAEQWKIIFEGGYLLWFIKALLFARLFTSTVINKIFMIILIILIFATVPLVYNVYNLVYVSIGIGYLDKIIYLQKKEKQELE